jgi:hypothetical protein
MELEAVKRERTALLASLAALKQDQGKAGGELQLDDARRLRRELELKQTKLNELKQVTQISPRVPLSAGSVACRTSSAAGNWPKSCNV